MTKYEVRELLSIIGYIACAIGIICVNIIAISATIKIVYAIFN